MEFFGRDEFAESHDLIGSIPDVPSEYRSRVEKGKMIPGAEFANYDSDSPDAEVKDVATYLREKQDARKRGLATDWNPEIGEVTLLAFYNNLTVETLNRTLAEARDRYGKNAVKQMAISLAVEESRERRFELHRWQFEKVESRCDSRYWVYVKVLGKRVKSKPPVVDVKPGPKPDAKIELKPLMTVSEYQDKTAELDALRSRIKKLEDGGGHEDSRPRIRKENLDKVPAFSAETLRRLLGANYGPGAPEAVKAAAASHPLVAKILMYGLEYAGAMKVAKVMHVFDGK
jgi:hypothetical protein